jgi:hypothetical protein
MNVQPAWRPHRCNEEFLVVHTAYEYLAAWFRLLSACLCALPSFFHAHYYGEVNAPHVLSV